MRRILIIFLMALSFLSVAQTFPAKPLNYVTDEAGVLSESEVRKLNAKLKNFEDTSSNQIFVYIASSLNGADMTSLCQEIFTKWEIGAKRKDNGVLVGVFIEDRKFRIQTGYGLEGALPDILTKKIQDEDMKPEFKKGDYYEGIDAGIDKLMYFSGHEFSNEDMYDAYSDSNIGGWLLGFGPNIALLWIFLYNLFKGDKTKRKSQTYKIVLTVIAGLLAFIPCVGAFVTFFLLAIVIDFGSGSGGSSWTSSSSGSSWSSRSSSSSSSGSGFRGGGGGRSGGGGSSSSW